MSMWIIDEHGSPDVVAKAVAAASFDTFVDDNQRRLDREEAKLLLLNPGDDPTVINREIAHIKSDLGKLDDAERDLFEAARDACLAILKHVKSPYCGVTARPSRNPGDAPRGKTFTLSTSSYGWL